MAAPDYYVGTFPDGYVCDALDVVFAFDLPAPLAMAWKHMVRRGRKRGESLLADLDKSIDYLVRFRELVRAEAAGKLTADEPDEPAKRSSWAIGREIHELADRLLKLEAEHEVAARRELDDHEST
jgi:hypothetical protein